MENKLIKIQKKLDNEIAEYVKDGMQYQNDNESFVTISDIAWLIEQAKKVEELHNDVDFFIQRQEMNKVIIQELVSLEIPSVDEILTKVRS
ncbi:hypothetical protein ANABIO32_00790 [Rossellomorea marisflavi]|uniref:hypothetical protein n=1 Tax=Rossellomorea marisflavi TaxID=189381 RepID=UPI0025C7B159|nr:hypothetical protein [Rossellomorea marisflavi]GLI82393.1 hypothetical protein ANABIO32_00790 [Rossellomorea marisflavi]